MRSLQSRSVTFTPRLPCKTRYREDRMHRRSVLTAVGLATLLMTLPVHAASLQAGEVELALEGGQSVADLEVRLGGKVVGRTNAEGKLRFRPGLGLHELVVSGAEGRVAFTEFRLNDEEAASLKLALPTGRGEAVVQTDVFKPGIVSPAPATVATDKDEADKPETSKAETGKKGGKKVTELEGVKITGARRRTAVTQERRAATVVDTVTQAEIAAAGDSDAGEAFKRVTGVAIQDDVIIVRGLSDRYSSTLLNGAEIPSPNPSRRVVPLDIFPTELLGGLTVQKSYSVNLPGDFSGGAALLESRPIPSVNKGSVKLKVGGNSRTTFLNTLTHAGSDTDGLGFDDGLRDIPTFINGATDNNRVRLSSLSDGQRRMAARSLPNLWEARLQEDTPPDVGGSASYGGRIQGLGDDWQVGYLASGLYDYNTRFRREKRNDLRIGQTVDLVSIRDRSNQERTVQTVDTGMVGGFSVKYQQNHQIDLVTLLSRNTEKSTFFTQATVEDNFLRQDRRTLLDFVESQLSYNQLTGKHTLPFDNLDARLRWQVVYSAADRDVLDRRSFTLSRNVDSGDGLFRLALQSGEGDLPAREWEYLSDTALDGGADLELPDLFKVEEHSFGVKTGFRSTRKERDLNTVRYNYFNPGSQLSESAQAARLAPSPETFLIDTFFGAGGFDIRNANSQGVGGGNSEAYIGQQNVDAGYLSLDWSFGEGFKADLGFRIEDATIDVVTGDARQGPTTAVQRKERDVLPAFNGTWFINKQQQLRIGYSKTLNRPQFRELADVQFLDPETRFISFGNSALVQSEINNYDLRFEQYWSNSKAVSVALFYKDFTKPIEATVQSDSSGSPIRSFTNSPSATDYGVELDGRYGLNDLAKYHPLLGNLYVSGNVSLIKSEVQLGNSTRALQGQSPFIVNMTLGYTEPGRTEATLLLNMFGKRINEVGFDGLPNAEEQSYPVLDFNVRQNIGSSFRVAFKARNLLDPEIEVRQGNVAQRSYRLGRSVQLSGEYEF